MPAKVVTRVHLTTFCASCDGAPLGTESSWVTNASFFRHSANDRSHTRDPAERHPADLADEVVGYRHVAKDQGVRVLDLP